MFPLRKACRIALMCLTLYVTVTDASVVPEVVTDVLNPKSTVEDIIGKFRSEMSALIAQAGGEARATLTQAYQLADVMVATLQVAYADSLKKTFQELDGQQQKAFQDTYNVLRKIDKGVTQETNQVVYLSDTWATTLNSIANGRPLIIRYGPNYIQPQGFEGKLRITVQGFNPDRENPSLKIGTKEFQPNEKFGNQLSFVVSRTDFPFMERRTDFAYAKLTLYDSRQWLGLGHRRPVSYDLIFLVLPNKLGTYQYQQIVSVPKTETRDWSATIATGRTTTDNAENEACWSPPNGTIFDLGTVKLDAQVMGWFADGGRDNRYNQGGAKWFTQPTLSSDNTPTQKICVHLYARPTERNSSAQTQATVSAQTVRDYSEDATTDTGAVELEWDHDKSLDLNSNAKRSILSIRLFDEISHVLPATSPSDLQYLEITPDTRNGVVILAPQRKWD